ncbi:MAG: orotate phosphoribosyltransferase, partial [Sedimentisphaerales bacterium]|nr:orotate phosphoribosyltransferase [Sedimentisphaerales bacterium]
VVIIEDVITAGTSIRETMALLENYNKPAVKATIVSVDRMERGTTDLTAIDQARADFGIEVFSIVTVREVISYLHNRPINGKVLIDDAMKGKMEAYLAEYGAK